MYSKEYLQSDFYHECFDFRRVADEHSELSQTPGVLNIHPYWRVRPQSHFKSASEMRRWNNRWAGELAGSRSSHSQSERVDHSLMIKRGGDPSERYLESRVIYTSLVDPSFYVASDHEIDHWNWDPLYNAPENLRPLTHQQNSWNRGIRKNNTSGFIGVFLDRRRGTWYSQARDNEERRHCLGIYSNPLEASYIYDDFIRPLRGGYGVYNHPRTGERGLPSQSRTLLAA